MTASLRHVFPGEPFRPKAADWNTFVDTARGYGAERLIFRPGPLLPSNSLEVVSGILTSSITAASPSGLTGATNFTFQIWRPDPADTSDPQQYLQDSDDTVGVNRSQKASVTGKFVICVYVNGEWNPIWIDC